MLGVLQGFQVEFYDRLARPPFKDPPILISHIQFHTLCRKIYYYIFLNLFIFLIQI